MELTITACKHNLSLPSPSPYPWGSGRACSSANHDIAPCTVQVYPKVYLYLRSSSGTLRSDKRQRQNKLRAILKTFFARMPTKSPRYLNVGKLGLELKRGTAFRVLISLLFPFSRRSCAGKGKKFALTARNVRAELLYCSLNVFRSSCRCSFVRSLCSFTTCHANTLNIRKSIAHRSRP